MWIIPTENKSLLGVLNSKMGWWLVNKYCTQIQNGCQLIWKYFGQIPIPALNGELDAPVNKMIELNEYSKQITSNFLQLLQSKYPSMEHVPLGRKLKKWHELEFGVFLKEVEKARKKSFSNSFSSTSSPPSNGFKPIGKKLPEPTGTETFKPIGLAEQAEWMQYFNEQKSKVQSLQSDIAKTDRAIDQIVYELYGLTTEEIQIVEAATA